ncbi:MAG: hypothetical protein SFU56_15010 [Capsulimonadales bacterium]|nr:hypothetical protein [Capsulimonadales bacterium]
MGVIALALGASARYFTAPTPAVAVVSPDRNTPTLTPTGNGHLRFEPIWQLSAPALVDLAIAPNGESVAWVDRHGSIRRIDTETRRTVWETPPYPRLDSLRLSTHGDVLAFSRLNPTQTSVRFLDAARGPLKTALIPVQGAVWSAAITPDGRQAVIGTGNSLLYFLPMRHNAIFAGTPITVPGIPESITATTLKVPQPAPKGGTAEETVALVGTWEDGSVCAWGSDRLPRWIHEERRPDASYQVTVSQDGSTAAAVAYFGPHRESARLHVWDMTTGKLRFIEDLKGFAPQVAVSANGQQIAVTYARAKAGTGERPPDADRDVERKITLFDRAGRRLFEEKGGIFFAPELIGISADGRRLTVRDPHGTIWTLDHRGRTIARLTSAGKSRQLLRALTTEDGRYLLLYHSDNTLSLYRAVAS